MRRTSLEGKMADASDGLDDGLPLLTHGKPPQRRAGLIMGILVAINLLNYIDRWTISGVLPLLQDEKKNGFHHNLSDSQGGLLMTVFIGSYMIFSPVFGYFGDRINRKALIAVGIFFWSMFTVGGSFAQNYGQLLGARALVGIGEASYATIAPAIIADLYPVKQRTSMLALFYLAIPVGAALGFIVGGQVASAFGSWRWALRVSPPLGIVATIVYVLFTHDPPRGGTESDHQEHTQTSTSGGFRGMMQDIGAILKIRSFMWTTAGFTAVTFATGALAQWAPTLIHRQADIAGTPYSVSAASLVFGGITCFTGVIGTLGGSLLSNYFTPRTHSADALICGFGLLAAVPFVSMALALASYNIIGTWALIFVGELLLCLCWTPVGAITLYVVTPSRRASASAILILISHAFGDAFSPYLVGAVSDTMTKKYDMYDGNALMFSLMITAGVTFLGGIAFLKGSNSLPADRQAAAAPPPKTDYSLINDYQGNED
eukprot:m.486462 g.486462  ORF g.486462 m.486462 type:complete len:488 (+) comp24415_c0_seq1:34-1497(+)